MNRFSQLIMLARQNMRMVLIGVVVLLLLLNGGQWLYGSYVGKIEEIDSRIALLEQHRNTVADIETLRKQVEKLSAAQKKIDKLLFVAETEEEITSAIQILLQDKVVESGMASESIRPVRSMGDKGKDKEKKKAFQEVSIKARLTGTLSQFLHFVSNLYRSDQLFKVESVAIRPFKKTELKVFLELRGYFRIVTPDAKDTKDDKTPNEPGAKSET